MELVGYQFRWTIIEVAWAPRGPGTQARRKGQSRDEAVEHGHRSGMYEGM